MAVEVEFDWDDQYRSHLRAHRVSPSEFEQMIQNNPLDLAYDVFDNEDRYRSVGVTDRGRLLSAVWTIRDGKVRAITAFPARVADRKAFGERPQ